jgi:hypothetical protein
MRNMVQCLKCGEDNAIGTQFCGNCGNIVAVPQPQLIPNNKSNLKIVLIVLGCVFGSCVLCGLIGGIKESINPTPVEPQNIKKEDDITTKADKERDEHLNQAKIALADGFNEKEGKFGRLEDAEKHLSEIRYFDKQYKEAQPLVDEVNRRKQILDALPTPKEDAMIQTKIFVNGEKGGFGTVFIANITAENPTKYAIKDLQIQCEMMGASGTSLGIKRETVFEIVPAKSKKTFRNINFGFINSQVSKFNCTLRDLSIAE